MTGSGKTWKGTIPAMPDGTEVNFTVTVVNDADFTTTSDKFSYTVGDPAPDWSKLKLNEIYGAGADNEKFFELYNASDYPIKLTGVTIKKDEDLTWTGKDGQVVPAKGWYAIIGAKGTTADGFSSGFSSKKSVLIELFSPKEDKLDTFQRGDKSDAGEWGVSITNYAGSWSRVPDGTGKWMRTDTFTPGAANSTNTTEDDYVKN